MSHIAPARSELLDFCKDFAIDADRNECFQFLYTSSLYPENDHTKKRFVRDGLTQFLNSEVSKDTVTLEKVARNMKPEVANAVLNAFEFGRDYLNKGNCFETVEDWKRKKLPTLFTNAEQVSMRRNDIFAFLELVREQSLISCPKYDGYSITGSKADDDDKNVIPRKNHVKGMTKESLQRLEDCLKNTSISGGYQNYSLNIQSGGGEESYGNAPYSAFFEQQYKHVFDNNIWTNIFENAYANLAANGVKVQQPFKDGIEVRIKALNDAYRNLIKARKALELANNSNPMYAARNMINNEGLVNDSKDADLNKLAQVPCRVSQLVDENNQRIDRCQNSLMKHLVQLQPFMPYAPR